MAMKYAILSSLLSLTLAVPAVAGELVIPVVYRGGGAQGTLWRTQIAVTNVTRGLPLPFVSRVTITLERGTSETPISVSMPLQQMESVSIPDAVHDWFNLENGGGIVRVTWTDENAKFDAWARIYNVGSAAGEFGQFVPARAPAELVKDNYLTGISGTQGNRTNVGVANPNAEDVLVWIEIFDQAGESHGSVAVSIPARSFKQYNDIFWQFSTEPQHTGVVSVRSTTLPVYAYASVVRGDTGDATFVVPAR